MVRITSWEMWHKIGVFLKTSCDPANVASIEISDREDFGDVVIKLFMMDGRVKTFAFNDDGSQVLTNVGLWHVIEGDHTDNEEAIRK